MLHYVDKNGNRAELQKPAMFIQEHENTAIQNTIQILVAAHGLAVGGVSAVLVSCVLPLQGLQET